MFMALIADYTLIVCHHMHVHKPIRGSFCLTNQTELFLIQACKHCCGDEDEVLDAKGDL